MRYTKHHTWCNFSSFPLTDCIQCPDLWEKYPYSSADEEYNLHTVYFPDVFKIGD
jgi:hypothetical protein